MRFNLLQICPSVPSFVYAVLLVLSFNIFSVFFSLLLNLGADPMHCLNFDKFRDTAPSTVIKRENLAKFKAKTTRICTHNNYERQKADSIETFTGKSKKDKLKRFLRPSSNVEFHMCRT